MEFAIIYWWSSQAIIESGVGQLSDREGRRGERGRGEWERGRRGRVGEERGWGGWGGGGGGSGGGRVLFLVCFFLFVVCFCFFLVFCVVFWEGEIGECQQCTWNGFSPVWVRMCLIRPCLFTDLKSQCEQLKVVPVVRKNSLWHYHRKHTEPTTKLWQGSLPMVRYHQLANSNTKTNSE